MLLSFAPAVVAALLLLLLPGIIWAWWRYPAPEGSTRLAVGLAVGLAFQFHTCALLSWGPGITQSTVLLATAFGIAVAAVLVRCTRLRRRPLPAGLSRRHSLQLVGLLGVVALPRLAPLILEQIPSGWDPSFHTLLASTTLASHRLPAWSPFEQIPSNYPYGPHVFIAQISLVTGIAPDSVFAVLINGVLPTCTCLALYALARRVLRGYAYALSAVATYGLLGNWGSIQYLLWGGLPNELGLFMLLVFLVVLFAPAYDRTRILVGGLILGAIPLSHHHVMLTTAMLLLVYALYLAVRWFRSPGHPALRRQLMHAFIRLSLMSVLAVVTVSYYVIPLALRADSLGSTRVAQFLDDLAGVPFEKNGLLLWMLAAIGGALMIGALQANRRSRAKLRARFAAAGTPGLARAFVVSASTTLLVAFVLCYYVYRFYSFNFTSARQPFTLFTPTRFLTDLTYFLAFFAAIPLARLWHWSIPHLPCVNLGPATARVVSRAGVRVAISIVVMNTAISLLDIPAIQRNGHLQVGEAEAFAWIQTHTPGNTLVVNLNPSARWAPYFTQREVAYTPVPISEFTAGYVNEKRALFDELLNLSNLPIQPRVLAFAATGSTLSSVFGRPIALLTDHPLPDRSVMPAYTSGPEKIYLLGDAFQRIGMAPSQVGLLPVQWWQPGDRAPEPGWNATTVGTSAGWSAGVPPTIQDRTTVYVRLQFARSLPSGATLACRVQSTVAVYLDGQQLGDSCSGKLVPMRRLSDRGPHVVALRAVFGAGMDPWLNILIAAPITATG